MIMGSIDIWGILWGDLSLGIEIWDIFEYNIVISHVSKDDTMFTLYEHKPACVILTLLDFVFC